MEECEIITAIVYNDRFTEPLNRSAWILENLLAGVVAGNFTSLDRNIVQIEWTGTANTPYDGIDFQDFRVTVPASELDNWDSDLVASVGVVFTALATTSSSVHLPGQEMKVNIYPKPADEYIYVSAPPATGSIELFSMHRQMIFRQPLIRPIQEIEIPPGLNGVYLIHYYS